MSQPIVTVKQGKLKGGIVENVLGGKYIAFWGIPYAVPPVGKLRFKVSWNLSYIILMKNYSKN